MGFYGFCPEFWSCPFDGLERHPKFWSCLFDGFLADHKKHVFYVVLLFCAPPHKPENTKAPAAPPHTQHSGHQAPRARGRSPFRTRGAGAHTHTHAHTTTHSRQEHPKASPGMPMPTKPQGGRPPSGPGGPRPQPRPGGPPPRPATPAIPHSIPLPPQAGTIKVNTTHHGHNSQPINTPSRGPGVNTANHEFP